MAKQRGQDDVFSFSSEICESTRMTIRSLQRVETKAVKMRVYFGKCAIYFVLCYGTEISF